MLRQRRFLLLTIKIKGNVDKILSTLPYYFNQSSEPNLSGKLLPDDKYLPDGRLAGRVGILSVPCVLLR